MNVDYKEMIVLKHVNYRSCVPLMTRKMTLCALIS